MPGINIDSFNYPITPTLPETYDNSFSFMELLGKMSSRLNQLITAVNGWFGSLDGYEKTDNITNNRKLSPTGDFSGTIRGHDTGLVLNEIGSNAQTLRILSGEFADGQTGQVIDGGFFDADGIKRNYDGGKF